MNHERRLHIGGTKQKQGWEIFNIVSGRHVDHTGNALRMDRFQDNTFEKIYASHILEHLSYYQELPLALLEWKRILKPGGSIFLSVPDMDIICKFISDESLKIKDIIYAMRMLFGGQTNTHDYHKVGFNFRILHWYLEQAGFEQIIRVERFDIFQDSSMKKFKESFISLNVVAKKNITFNQSVL